MINSFILPQMRLHFYYNKNINKTAAKQTSLVYFTAALAALPSPFSTATLYEKLRPSQNKADMPDIPPSPSEAGTLPTSGSFPDKSFRYPFPYNGFPDPVP